MVGAFSPYFCSSASSHTDDRRKKTAVYGLFSLNHGQKNPQGFEDLQSVSSESFFFINKHGGKCADCFKDLF